MAGKETPRLELLPYGLRDEQSVREIMGDMHDPEVWENPEQLYREGVNFERFVGKKINKNGTIGESLATFRLTREGAGFQVARLAVAQAFQRMGIATQLLENEIPGIVTDTAKDDAVQNPPLYLIVDADNIAAQELYKKVFPEAYKTVTFETRVPHGTQPLDIRENIERRKHETLVSRVDIFERLYAYYEKALKQKKRLRQSLLKL